MLKAKFDKFPCIFPASREIALQRRVRSRLPPPAASPVRTSARLTVPPGRSRQFPAGSYIRNPPTSRHTPGSAPGCILFVKLWQFDPADRRHVAINTASSAYRAAADRPVVQLLPLFCDSREDVRLERWAPGAAITLTVSGGAEVLVLDGAFDEGGEHFEAQSWLRLPAGGVLQAKAGAAGCRVWVKTGHLLHVEGIIRS
jgi:anti-sigma factor ChrR (cupin superfamily)